MLKRSSSLCFMVAVLGLLLASAAPGNILQAAQRAQETLPSDAKSSVKSAGKSAVTAESTAPAMYIVQLQDAPLASYRGDVNSLAATSPAASGARKLLTDSQASRSYRSYLTRQRTTVLDQMTTLVGGRLDVRYTYDVAFNGVGVMLTPADAAQVAQLPGVVHVTRAAIQYPQTDAGPRWIKANSVWDGTATGLYVATILGANVAPPVPSAASGNGTFELSGTTLSYNVTVTGIAPISAHIHRGAAGVTGPVVAGLTAGSSAGTYSGSLTLSPADITLLQSDGLYIDLHSNAYPSGEIRGQISGRKGEGMLVGIIDTGINFSHPSFAAKGGDGYNHVNPFGAGHYIGVCNPSDPSYQPAKVCNAKLVGARTYPDTIASGDSPEDDDGHGSHTASTVAGNVIIDPLLNGISFGTISGVAPHANIIAYDGCNVSGGCPTAALVAAIDDAVADGVDVINYSIGGDSRDPWTDPTAIAFLNARAAGVFVSVSAGNKGPNAATIGSPSNAPWVTAVGASTHNRVLINSLTDLTSTGGTLPDIAGRSITGSYSSHPIVYAGDAPYNNPLCYPFPANTFTGEIVICDRGTLGRAEKGQNVLNGGGGGMVLVNDSANGNSLVADAHVLPAVHISYANGVTLKNWLASGSSHMAAISGTTKDMSDSNGDVMAGFSSRGPDASVPNIVKPDVAAPGVDVFAAFINDPSTVAPDYGILSGTSMAAPHDAGAAVLVRSLHPDWTPAEVQSALMTTSIQSGVRKEDGTTAATPFDRGAGRIDVSRAVRAGLVLDETKANYLAANPADGGDPATLNIASMGNSACLRCTWVRVLKSTLATPSTWNASFTPVSGVSLTITPASFTIPAHGQQTITITASATTPIVDATVFSALKLVESADRAPAASFPIAVNTVASVLPDRVDIQTRPTSGAKAVDGLLHVNPISALTSRKYGLVKATLSNVALPGDPDTDASLYNDLTTAGGVSIKTITVPAGSKRLVAELTASTALDVDLYIYRDGANGGTLDGVPSANELLCASATADALEYCSLTEPAAGAYLILVHNFEGSAAATDQITLATAIVPATNAGNMTVTGPASVAAATPFSVSVGWNIPTLQVGDRWYGGFDLGTNAANPGNIGFVPVDVQRLANLRLFLPLIRR